MMREETAIMEPRKKVQLPVSISLGGRRYDVCQMAGSTDIMLFGKIRIVRVMRDDEDVGEEDGRHFAKHQAKISTRFCDADEYGFVFAGWVYEDGAYACFTRISDKFMLAQIYITDKGDFHGWGVRSRLAEL